MLRLCNLTDLATGALKDILISGKLVLHGNFLGESRINIFYEERGFFVCLFIKPYLKIRCWRPERRLSG